MSEKTVSPILVRGKHNEAVVYAKALESTCENKIRQYLDHPAFAGTTVRIMPDVHLGKGTVIGFDIGCGVSACNLGRGKLAFDKLDKFVRKNIPSGQAVRSSLHEALEEANVFVSENNKDTGLSDMGKLCHYAFSLPPLSFAMLFSIFTDWPASAVISLASLSMTFLTSCDGAPSGFKRSYGSTLRLRAISARTVGLGHLSPRSTAPR